MVVRLDSHIKYMGTPPGPAREVRLRRAPPAAQTPAGGARGGMLSMEAGRARCRPGGPRTQPAPAMWRSTCISYGVRIRPMHLGTLRAPPYKYMGHPPCNLADKRVNISKSGQVGSRGHGGCPCTLPFRMRNRLNIIRSGFSIPCS